MADQAVFEGLKVADREVEMGGGGTSRETAVAIGLGDTGTATVEWKCVSVKHPMKSGVVVRVQTLNITEVEIDATSIQRYAAPPEQPTLDASPDDGTEP